MQAAGAARDGRDHRAAAALYEQALAYRPDHAGLHIQAGHMFKEAGALGRAETHYLRAADLLPDDAELALQLGHFYKVAGRPDEAELAYARALALRPGWRDPAGELARLAGTLRGEAAPAEIVAALLPRPIAIAATLGEGVQIHRLGTRARPTAWGDLKRLSGIEAVRGRCVSAAALDALHILIDEVELHREPLTAVGGAYPFNAWIDVGAVAPGPHRIELRFTGPGGTARLHRETLAVVPPEPHPQSDAWVEAPGDGDLAARVAALPSAARPALRAPFVGPFRTILVQRADQLGDMAASVPAIRRLRALVPDAGLVGLVTPANAELARTLGLFDEMVEVRFDQDGADGHRALSGEAQIALRRTLAAFAFDLAIDLGQVAASRPLLLLSGARQLYGFADPTCPWLDAGFHLAGHDPVNRHDIVPPARKLLALVEALGAMLAPAAPEPRAVKGNGAIVLHDGARLPWSRWPHYAELARLLLGATDRPIVLLGEGHDALPADPRLTVIDQALPFAKFDALLGGCALFVGNDSGPKHLAALRGAPVLSLHMARLNWSEWGQEASGTILSRRVPCAGCGITRPEECAKDFACIRGIRPEEALAEALKLLAA